MDTLFICGGESGTIYFINTTLRGTSAIEFQFEAHEGTILALYAQAPRPGRGDGTSYHVVSGDAMGNVRAHAVNVELRCKQLLQAFRLAPAILHFARLDFDIMSAALRDGTLMLGKKVAAAGRTIVTGAMKLKL